MAKLKVNSKAPNFSLLDQNNKRVKLSDFKGNKLLIYFYPKADTPGCTKQACSVSASLASLRKSGVEVVGVSPDSPEQQTEFDKKYELGFQLLSDPDHSVADSYGVWGEKSMYGEKYEGIIRSSFLIDEKGAVKRAWYKVKPLETVSSVMAVL